MRAYTALIFAIWEYPKMSRFVTKDKKISKGKKI